MNILAVFTFSAGTKQMFIFIKHFRNTLQNTNTGKQKGTQQMAVSPSNILQLRRGGDHSRQTDSFCDPRVAESPLPLRASVRAPATPPPSVLREQHAMPRHNL